MPKIISVSEENEMLRLFHCGTEIKQIAVLVSCSPTTVYRVLREHDVTFKLQQLTIRNKRIVHEYQDGKEITALATENGMSKDKIYALLDKTGVRKRKPINRIPTQEDLRFVLDSLADGLTVREISSHRNMEFYFFKWRRDGRRNTSGPCGEFEKAVSEVIGRSGAIARGKRKYELDEDYFKEINTEEKAYWLGFIAADGCVTRDSLAIGLATPDRGHLELFLRCVKSNVPIRDKPPGTMAFPRINGGYVSKTAGASYICITSKAIKSDLERHGIMMRKSLVLKPWNGPQELLPAYWRGAVDGDGCIYKGTTSRQWNIAFCGNFDMVNGFRNFVREYFPEYKVKVEQRKNKIPSIRYSGNNSAYKVTKLLYENTAIALERKKDLASKMFVEFSKRTSHS